MKKTKMLKKNYEFRQVLSKGKYYSGKYVNAFILNNKKSYNLLGLAISTKCGKAYQRNRIKRLIRENYKNLEINIKVGYSIVFLIKKDKNIDEIDFLNNKRDLENIFKLSNILIKDMNE